MRCCNKNAKNTPAFGCVLKPPMDSLLARRRLRRTRRAADKSRRAQPPMISHRQPFDLPPVAHQSGFVSTNNGLREKRPAHISTVLTARTVVLAGGGVAA